MATTTPEQIALLNAFFAKEDTLDYLKKTFGKETAEIFYNGALAQLAAAQQETGSITYNPYFGIIYIGSGYDASKDGSTIDVAKLVADAQSKCGFFKTLVQETWGGTASSVLTKLPFKLTNAQRTAMKNFLNDLFAAYKEWDDSWFKQSQLRLIHRQFHIKLYQ